MKKNYCWYTSFGSNMLKERFYSYILGGKSSITGTYYHGCRDKTLPLENRGCFLNHPLYFSRNSRTWENGGVAFIDIKTNSSVKTPARSYLITKDQFADILCQENGRDPGEHKMDINFNDIVKKGFLSLKNLTWYNTILFTGLEKGIHSFTFTGSPKNDTGYSEPGDLYLTTIIRGMIETFDFTDKEIIGYLKNAEGIKNNETEKFLELIYYSRKKTKVINISTVNC